MIPQRPHVKLATLTLQPNLTKIALLVMTSWIFLSHPPPWHTQPLYHPSTSAGPYVDDCKTCTEGALFLEELLEPALCFWEAACLHLYGRLFITQY